MTETVNVPAPLGAPRPADALLDVRGLKTHFHVMDGPSALAADGVPYVFDAFHYNGEIPPLSEAAAYYESQQPVPIADAGAGERHDALPLGGDVVTFPDPRAP